MPELPQLNSPETGDDPFPREVLLAQQERSEWRGTERRHPMTGSAVIAAYHSPAPRHSTWRSTGPCRQEGRLTGAHRCARFTRSSRRRSPIRNRPIARLPLRAGERDRLRGGDRRQSSRTQMTAERTLSSGAAPAGLPYYFQEDFSPNCVARNARTPFRRFHARAAGGPCDGCPSTWSVQTRHQCVSADIALYICIRNPRLLALRAASGSTRSGIRTNSPIPST